MELKRETVKAAYQQFVARFGLPPHIKSEAQMETIIDFDYEELKTMFDEEKFTNIAMPIAKRQARRFPCIPDFYKGYDVPEKQSVEEILKGYNE